MTLQLWPLPIWLHVGRTQQLNILCFVAIIRWRGHFRGTPAIRLI